MAGKPLSDPRLIRFRTGRRRKVWHKNCVALGLASGFIEPLESTSIHLIVTGVTRLMQMFPFAGITPSLVEEYNRLSESELAKIRDFIILHYHVTQRRDSAFWRHCAAMDIPQTLARRIELFRENGQAFQTEGELFRVDSWVQVMVGQGLLPERCHHLACMMSDDELRRFLGGLKGSIAQAVERLPDHQTFIDRYCAVESV